MTSTDIVVIVVGLVVGYFVVSWLLGSVGRGAHQSPQSPQSPHGPRATPGGGTGSGPAPGSGPRPWYEVLQVPVYASFDDVKQAYRRRIAEYHPDRASGLGEELRQLAESRAKEINVAYDAALRAFGKRHDSDRSGPDRGGSDRSP